MNRLPELMSTMVEMQADRFPGIRAVEPMERRPTRTEYKDGWSLRFQWPLTYRYESDGASWYGRTREIENDGWYWQWPFFIEEWFTVKDIPL